MIKTKKQKGTKKCVVRRKLYKDYKHCLEATQIK